MSDVAGVNDECRLLRQAVHPIDAASEHCAHIRIRLFIETNVRVTDLHEQRLAFGHARLSVIRGHGADRARVRRDITVPIGGLVMTAISR